MGQAVSSCCDCCVRFGQRRLHAALGDSHRYRAADRDDTSSASHRESSGGSKPVPSWVWSGKLRTSPLPNGHPRVLCIQGTRYQVEGLLGEGTYGFVYLVKDTTSSSLLAAPTADGGRRTTHYAVKRFVVKDHDMLNIAASEIDLMHRVSPHDHIVCYFNHDAVFLPGGGSALGKLKDAIKSLQSNVVQQHQAESLTTAGHTDETAAAVTPSATTRKAPRKAVREGGDHDLSGADDIFGEFTSAPADKTASGGRRAKAVPVAQRNPTLELVADSTADDGSAAAANRRLPPNSPSTAPLNLEVYLLMQVCQGSLRQLIEHRMTQCKSPSTVPRPVVAIAAAIAGGASPTPVAAMTPTVPKLFVPPVFSTRTVIHVMREVAEALRHLHDAQSPPVYHWDVKIENVLFVVVEPPAAAPSPAEGADQRHTDSFRGLQFLLCDLGSARRGQPLGPCTSAPAVHAAEAYLDETMTLLYRAPETIDLWSRKAVTEKCDVWALGVIAYVLLMGTMPFEASKAHILSARPHPLPPSWMLSAAPSPLNSPAPAARHVAPPTATKNGINKGTASTAGEGVSDDADEIEHRRICALVDLMLNGLFVADPDKRLSVNAVLHRLQTILGMVPERRPSV